MPSSLSIGAASTRVRLGQFRLVQLVTGVVALHVADDNFLQPNPGTTAADHLASGLIPLALLAAGAVAYGRLRAGARAAVALLLGFLGVLVSIEAMYYTRAEGASGDDYSGLLSLPAGFLLLGLGAFTLWTSRTTGDPLWRRYGRRVLIAAGVAVCGMTLLLPVGISYVVTHTLRAEVPAARLGVAHEDVAFTTSDGLRLKGWYIPSRNGAAVISFPGRSDSQTRARFLARRGYGVLLFDRRGEGESEGDPNIFGWQGDLDVHAAVRFLQSRPDVDPERIGGIGLSVGGEILIEAAAESSALKGIVSEGASSRSLRDDLANGGSTLELVSQGAITLATAVFTGNLPPRSLESLVPKIAPRSVFFVYGEHGQPMEERANSLLYAAARGPRQIWEVPGSGHMGGTEAQPREYERRIVAFFDRALAAR